MNNEQARLETFKPGEWECSFVSPELLAKCGFYFTGERDLVQCFNCKGRLEGWEDGDNPVALHKKQFPHCGFIQDYTETHPDEEGYTKGETVQDAALIDYSTYESRLASFQILGWNKPKPTPGKLAEAGFFYTGKNDQVECFACDGKLWNWQPHDDPWVDHKDIYPDCQYIAQNYPYQ